jgi:fluoride ion exporter CrcB/FEX
MSNAKKLERILVTSGFAGVITTLAGISVHSTYLGENGKEALLDISKYVGLGGSTLCGVVALGLLLKPVVEIMGSYRK